MFSILAEYGKSCYQLDVLMYLQEGEEECNHVNKHLFHYFGYVACLLFIS